MIDSVENTRTLGLFNGEPAVDRAGHAVSPAPTSSRPSTACAKLLPELRAQLPQDIDVQVASDRTNSIRASLREIEITLMISIVLVVLVVGLFLRKARATIVPAVATVVSLLGTFGVMYLLGFSLNNLSLMALTVATGFVVDDAIVVLENTTRHVEAGMNRVEAALRGAREVGFTVLSISLSLVAVFIPLLFMGGQVGRLFREFAVTLSASVLISLVISLTTTPMMCALLLRSEAEEAGKPPGRAARLVRPRRRARLERHAAHLRPQPRLGAGQQGRGDGGAAGGDRPQRLPVQRHPQGLLPAAGQRPAQCRPARRPEHLVGGHRRQAAQAVDIIRKDPAVDTVVGLHGRRPRGRRLHVRQPQAGVAAHRARPRR